VSSSATGHFIAQRVSAVVLVVLGLWFAISLSGLQGMQHAIVLAFVADPINSIVLMVFCATLAYHSYLGVQVVIEDYVHAPRLLWFSLMVSRAVHLAVGLLLVYTVYDIGFSA
jgi:succinate dehydrogenase / fumarate reductase membrane anchor subunit